MLRAGHAQWRRIHGENSVRCKNGIIREFRCRVTRVGTIANVPTELVGSATLAYVAVMLSLFLIPVMVPVNSGLASPYWRLAFAASLQKEAQGSP